MTASRPALRAAVADDKPRIAAILAANDEPVTTATGEAPYLDMLLATARLVVAERGGSVLGFGSVVQVGPVTHLADLFIDPAAQGTGLGQALLAELYADAWPRTTFASADPRALPLYVRFGMQPGWPNLYLTADQPRLPSTGLRVEASTPEICAPIETLVTGRMRAEIQWQHGRPGSTLLLVTDADGTTAGVAITHDRWKWPGRALERVVVAADADPVEVVLAVLGAEPSEQPIATILPGPHPALRRLLEAGFRIADSDTFMASEPGLVEPTRHVIDPTML